MLLLLALLLSFTSVLSLEVSVQNTLSLSTAAKHLEQIEKKSQHMKYGKCWTDALHVLKGGCKDLDDEKQRRIAYAFARCHLLSSGRQIPECDELQPISDCTKENILPEYAFSTYTEFFTHSQQICFHLQEQVWHEATEDQIGRLLTSSVKVADELLQTSLVANEIAEKQDSSLKNQAEIIQNANLLQNNIKESQNQIQGIMSEHSAYFDDFFDRIAVLQRTVVGEFTDYSSLFYNVLMIFAVLLISTPTRTSSVRFYLFIIVALNFTCERFMITYFSSSTWMGMFFDMIHGDSFSTEESFYNRIWFFRKFSCFVCISIAMFAGFRYKDYNKVNNLALLEVMKQNQQILDEIHKLRREGFEVNESVLLRRMDLLNLVSKHQDENRLQLQQPKNFDKLTDDDDDVSYHPDNDSASSSPSSSSSSSGSDDEEGDVVKATIRSFRSSATPERGSRYDNDDDVVVIKRSRSVTPSRRLLGRLGLTPDRDILSPLANFQGRSVGGYNLRRRSSIVSPLKPVHEK